MNGTFQAVLSCNFDAIFVKAEENLSSVSKLLRYVALVSDVLIVLHYRSNGKS
jgi:hypothetical protein